MRSPRRKAGKVLEPMPNSSSAAYSTTRHLNQHLIVLERLNVGVGDVLARLRCTVAVLAQLAHRDDFPFAPVAERVLRVEDDGRPREMVEGYLIPLHTAAVDTERLLEGLGALNVERLYRVEPDRAPVLLCALRGAGAVSMASEVREEDACGNRSGCGHSVVNGGGERVYCQYRREHKCSRLAWAVRGGGVHAKAACSGGGA
eukprot:3513241-Prymnesium_polylepis.2